MNSIKIIMIAAIVCAFTADGSSGYLSKPSKHRRLLSAEESKWTHKHCEINCGLLRDVESEDKKREELKKIGMDNLFNLEKITDMLIGRAEDGEKTVKYSALQVLKQLIKEEITGKLKEDTELQTNWRLCKRLARLQSDKAKRELTTFSPNELCKLEKFTTGLIWHACEKGDDKPKKAYSALNKLIKATQREVKLQMQQVVKRALQRKIDSQDQVKERQQLQWTEDAEEIIIIKLSDGKGERRLTLRVKDGKAAWKSNKENDWKYLIFETDNQSHEVNTIEAWVLVEKSDGEVTTELEIWAKNEDGIVIDREVIEAFKLHDLKECLVF